MLLFLSLKRLKSVQELLFFLINSKNIAKSEALIVWNTYVCSNTDLFGLTVVQVSKVQQLSSHVNNL